ncbi:TPA: SAM-dependent methyltransferase [Candidatus Berkelbacteria bacterium]|uniref:Methyltransferase domain-containing protein n=1 Tax=Berkelbacteria bacterium GW2011_GWE1_39_12 TaxID=1618337 RepID=A0A0G4B5N9_9BACT|nr:MAG: hypothetical protein UT28_C0001G0512 [Berkelbacteria bacterium GW2011_GWE1_39_12]HBO60908.1 SAM-dependent methyltransferase [Candidatus Berkelbacteria bacterium]
MEPAKLDIPFVPSTAEKIRIMVKMANLQGGERMADLGSGDGRVVIAFAKAGAIAQGFEADPSRAMLGQKNIIVQGMEDVARISEKNFWKADLSEFNIITLFGITSMMKQMEKKLKKELKTGAKVISNTFIFPEWEPVQVENNVYLYVKN